MHAYDAGPSYSRRSRAASLDYQEEEVVEESIEYQPDDDVNKPSGMHLTTLAHAQPLTTCTRKKEAAAVYAADLWRRLRAPTAGRACRCSRVRWSRRLRRLTHQSTARTARPPRASAAVAARAVAAGARAAAARAAAAAAARAYRRAPAAPPRAAVTNEVPTTSRTRKGICASPAARQSSARARTSYRTSAPSSSCPRRPFAMPCAAAALP